MPQLARLSARMDPCAAMIGCQGYYEFLAGHTAGPELNAYATMPLEKQIG